MSGSAGTTAASADEYTAILARLQALKAGEDTTPEQLRACGIELAQAKRALDKSARAVKARQRPQPTAAGALRRARFAADAAVPAFSFCLHEWVAAFGAGDPVLVAAADRRALPATVLARAAGAGADEYAVRPAAAGGDLRVPAHHLVPAYPAWAASLRRGPLVVTTPDTETLRRLGRLTCTADDRVLEIGCSYGACSAGLCEAKPSRFLGIDNSAECVQACQAQQLDSLALPRETNPHPTFCQ